MVIKTVADVLEKALEKKRAGKEAEIFEKPVPPDRYEKGILAKADLTKRLEEAEYRKKLDRLQKRLEGINSSIFSIRALASSVPSASSSSHISGIFNDLIHQLLQTDIRQFASQRLNKCYKRSDLCRCRLA